MARPVKDIKLEIGGIKQKRVTEKMSHDKLAEITGYSAAVIQEVERGMFRIVP